MDEEELIIPDDCSIFAEPMKLAISEVNSFGARTELKFKKRLIATVRRYPSLYDPHHEAFKNVSAKDEKWQDVAKALKTDVDICKNTWVDLRYDYQRYVRRLQKFFKSGNKMRKRRPVMVLETDLIFLWRFVGKTALRCSLPYDDGDKVTEKQANSETVVDITSNQADDDIIMLDDDPVVVIELDDDDNGQYSYVHRSTITISKEMLQLIKIVEVYPELYNSKHRYFHDYKRKGIIWNAIANELSDKATKLLKTWIHIQTRYEWEISQFLKKDGTQQRLASDAETALEKALSFLKRHITLNPDTVYKQSYHLKEQWHEPVEHFKNIFNLLAVMKKHPNVVVITEEIIKSETKVNEFFVQWNAVAGIRAVSAGQCETTWLILRSFYWELLNMRKFSYQLADKWYFESIITDLYTSANANATFRLKPIETASKPSSKQSSIQSSRTNTPSPACTATINLDEDSIFATKIDTNQMLKTNATAQAKPKSVPSSSPQIIQMPKITSAKSLAVPPSTTFNKNSAKGVQIKPATITELPMAKTTAAHKLPQAPAAAVGSYISAPTMTTQKLPVKQPVKNRMGPVISNTYSCASTMGTPSNVHSALPTTTTATGRKTINNNINTIIPLNLPYSLPEHTTLSRPNVSPTTTDPASSNIVITAAKSDLAAGTAITSSLPKITGALSLLSPNEIMIELIASTNGNQLVVHGPPLTEKYSLSMSRTANFIHEVMAIPLLHNKTYTPTAKLNTYWQYLSTKFLLPTHICKAIWNFLSENFAHFPQIGRMEDLMKPFKSDIKAWTLSTDLFSNFELYTVKMEWLKYRDQLPHLMEEISKYENIYKGAPALNERLDSVSKNWHLVRTRFGYIDQLNEVWFAFRNVFLQYMSDLELGIDNKWPQKWWRVLAKMQFLMFNRYSTMEPFYYIVRNKIIEEIDRCNSLDMKMDKAPMSMLQETVATPAQSSFEITVIASPNSSPPILEPSPTPLPTLQTSSDVDAYSLIMAIKSHPEIYKDTTGWCKEAAWSKVAQQMKSDVYSCRLAFQRILKHYRFYVSRDTSNQCRINRKYFKCLSEIYRSVKQPHKLNIRTPSQLNQSVDEMADSNDTVVPERFIEHMNMDNSKPAVVMKNWSYAIDSFPTPAQSMLEGKLRSLFDKYRPSMRR